MVGRSCPARKYFYKPNILGHLDLTQNWGARSNWSGAPVRPVHDEQNLYKSYLPHPNSDLDVPHMNLDLVDKRCARQFYPILIHNCIFSLTENSVTIL
jgi:hypothetical protein